MSYLLPISPSSTAPKQGFALVIALSLMAFVLLLLLSITTLVQVETQSAQISVARMEAEQNAILAARIALGDLQKYLGPDQRVTARGRRFDTNPYDSDDLTTNITDGVDPVIQNWIGVWQTQRGTNGFGQTSFKTWLVSGLSEMEKATSATILNKSMTGASVVTFLDSQNQVSVDKVPLSSDSDSTGSYAYWVSDNSVKARANLGVSPAQNPALSSQSFGIGHVFDYAKPFDALSPDVLSRALSHDSFKALAGGGAQISNLIDAHFHDVSYHGMAVLCDTLEGGLKRDLTDAFFDSPDTLNGPIFEPIGGAGPSLRDPGGPTWESLIDWSNKSLIGGSLPVDPLSATSIGYSPVVTGLQMYWVPSYDAVSGAVRLNLMPAVTLWNPYDKPLEAQDYTIQFGHQKIASGSVTDFSSPWLYNWKLKVSGNGNFVRLRDLMNDHPFTFYFNSGVLSPGEAVVFGPPQKHTAYDVSALPSKLSATLVPGYNPGYSFYINTGLNIDPSKPNPTYGHPGWTDSRALAFKLCLGTGTSNPLQVSVYQSLMGLTRHYSQTSASGLQLTADPIGGPIPDGVRLYAWGMKMLRTFIDNERIWNGSDNFLPGSYQWLANYDPRAFYNGPCPSSFSSGSSISTSNSAALNPSFILSIHKGSLDMDVGFQPFDLGRSVSVGYSEVSSFAEKTILFQSAPDRSSMHSIGQLSHAPLYPYLADEDDNFLYARFGNLNPAYAIGNSLADPRIDLDQISVDWSSRYAPKESIYAFNGVHHDLSYKLNDALWDDYFFSARTTAGDANVSVPIRLAKYTDGTAGVPYGFWTSARSLMIDGPFNINSTSVGAWKALLSSFNQSNVIRQDETEDAPSDHSSAFTRIDHPHGGPVDISAGAYTNEKESYLGYRSLSPVEIQLLAEKIVEEVKLRGPFSCVAEFINRMPNQDPPTDGRSQESLNAFRLRGALSAAIEKAAINSGFKGDPSLKTTPSGAFGINSEAEQGWRAENLPGWLSQADILSRVGNVLTARSDSFTIYAYGESINPISGEVYSKKCEMVVQRIPSYVDSAGNLPETPLDSISASELSMAPLNTENETFGRRFIVVSFKWVDPS